MNKFLKISLLAALVMVVLGAVLAMAGRAAAAGRRWMKCTKTGTWIFPL